LTVLRSGSASDVGRVRAVNEDLALESLTLFAVADGMGGHAGGEIASRTAIDALESEFGRKPSIDGLVDAVHEANRAVWERGHADPDLRGMGTTLTAAALVSTDEGDRLVLANVGDSRAYRFHGTGLTQLTTDHSVAEELVKRGELSEAEAAIHPHRHILTRALGISPDIDVDVWQVVPEEGDRYLLCSDGLTNEIPAEEITRVLSELRDPQAAAETLVRMANEAGGSDNITAVVLDVVVGEPSDASRGEGSNAVGVPADGRVSDGAAATTEAAPVSAAGALATVEARSEAPSSSKIEQVADNGAQTALVGRSAAATQVGPRRAGPVPPTRPRGPRRITFRCCSSWSSSRRWESAPMRSSTGT
jgi:protein phosphatase